MKNIEILYEDDFILAVNKPAGLAVQGGKGIKSSLDKILAEIRSPPPLLVHRLDMDTSGVILTAKTREAAARYSSLISGRKAQKQYTAVCASRPGKTQGVIKEELLIRGKAKKSETGYRLLKTGVLSLPQPQEYSVLELELGTGRMHQIRRHLSMTGTPILGDDKYGNFPLNKILRKSVNLKRLLLHAARLIIDDIDITAPLPDYFKPFV